MNTLHNSDRRVSKFHWTRRIVSGSWNDRKIWEIRRRINRRMDRSENGLALLVKWSQSAEKRDSHMPIVCCDSHVSLLGSNVWPRASSLNNESGSNSNAPIDFPCLGCSSRLFRGLSWNMATFPLAACPRYFQIYGTCFPVNGKFAK